MKYLIFLSLIPLISCNSNNDFNKELDYFESIHNAEDENIEMMIEESGNNQSSLLEEQVINNQINFKMDSILNVEKNRLDSFTHEYNTDTSRGFLKIQVEEQTKHVAIIQSIVDRD